MNTDNGNLDALFDLMMEVPEFRDRLMARMKDDDKECDAGRQLPPRGEDGDFIKTGPDAYGLVPPPGILCDCKKGERYSVEGGTVNGHTFRTSVPIPEYTTAEDALSAAIDTRRGLKLLVRGLKVTPPEMRPRVLYALGRFPGANDGFPLRIRRNGDS